MSLMKSFVLVGLVGLLLADVACADSRYFNGVVGAVNENSKVGYIKLRRYSVVVDGRDISSIDLLRLKGVAKSMQIPNIMFINDRFLVFGDYSRAGDAKMIRRKLKKVFGRKVVVNVVESAVFGESAVVTPILVGAYRNRGRGKYDSDVLLSDEIVNSGSAERYDVVPSSTYSVDENGIARDIDGEPIEIEKFEYDNRGYDESIKESGIKSDEETVLDLFKSAQIFQNYIFVGNKRVYINKSYQGFKVIDINYADKSFLIRNENGDTFLVEGKMLIKL